jgi:hypothetical protein
MCGKAKYKAGMVPPIEKYSTVPSVGRFVSAAGLHPQMRGYTHTVLPGTGVTLLPVLLETSLISIKDGYQH